MRLIGELVDLNEEADQSLYLQVTRGAARRDLAFPAGVAPTVFMMSNPLVTSTPELVESGVAAVSAADNRWLRCNIKAISLLPNVLLGQLAVDAGAAETLLLRDGFLTEGAASNIFVVRDDALLAPPKDHLMLPGITYDVILELAASASFKIEVRRISEHEVRTAQELWLTSSTKEVLAITHLDSQPVADGKPGPLFRRMHRLYHDYKNTVMRVA